MKLKEVLKNFFKSGCISYDQQLKPREKRLTKEEVEKLQKTIDELKSVIDMNKIDTITPDTMIQHNIYDSGPTLGKYVDNQNRVHKHWKHRFFYPIYYIGTRILGKYIVKEVPDALQFKNLRIIDKAMEKTFHDWCTFVTVMKHKGDDITKKDVEAEMGSITIKMMRKVKEMALTLCKNDTAYMEMASIFAFNLAVEMNKNHEPDPKHIVYTSKNISDPAYFRALFDLNNNRVILKPLKDPFKPKGTATEAEPKNECKVISDEVMGKLQ